LSLVPLSQKCWVAGTHEIQNAHIGLGDMLTRLYQGKYGVHSIVAQSHAPFEDDSQKNTNPEGLVCAVMVVGWVPTDKLHLWERMPCTVS